MIKAYDLNIEEVKLNEVYNNYNEPNYKYFVTKINDNNYVTCDKLDEKNELIEVVKIDASVLF